MMDGEAIRVRFWSSLSVRDDDLMAELLAYTRDRFDFSRLPSRYPLPDEPFVETWSTYETTARQHGVFPYLRDRLIQLQFQIAAGISATPQYQAATRRGVPPGSAQGALTLTDPAGVKLFIHRTIAGRVPVLVVSNRRDFERLVQALGHKNEPTPVPASMGACIVSGLINWDRVQQLRRAWEASASSSRSASDWNDQLKVIAVHPALYQDRLLILSTGAYSATPPAEVNLTEADWLARSHVLRLEHECTHYFTRVVLGAMRNVVLDELVADYIGIVAAHGTYRPDWHRSFLGLTGAAPDRVSGRLANYRGTPPLSDGALEILRIATERAIENLARCDEARPPLAERDETEKARAIVNLLRLGLEGLASESGPEAFVRLSKTEARS